MAQAPRKAKRARHRERGRERERAREERETERQKEIEKESERESKRELTRKRGTTVDNVHTCTTCIISIIVIARCGRKLFGKIDSISNSLKTGFFR